VNFTIRELVLALVFVLVILMLSGFAWSTIEGTQDCTGWAEKPLKSIMA
jgi:hypothetical protein